jgi:hypothetical protein
MLKIPPTIFITDASFAHPVSFMYSFKLFIEFILRLPFPLQHFMRQKGWNFPTVP